MYAIRSYYADRGRGAEPRRPAPCRSGRPAERHPPTASLADFLYTAATLTGRLIDTFWMILVLIVVNLIVKRWLALATQKIAVDLVGIAAVPGRGEVLVDGFRIPEIS